MNNSTTKLVADLAMTWGLSKVVRDVIRNNVVIETGAEQIQVWIGTFVIGGMIYESASDRIHGQIDSVYAWFNKEKEEVEEVVDGSVE